MPRERTGTLIPPGRDGMWKGRITAEDGSRPIYSLGTADEALAKRKLARLVAGELPAAICGETVGDYAKAWLERREAQGVKKDEGALLEHHVLEAIGGIMLTDVKTAHIRGVLDEALAKGLKRGTLEQIRGVMNRLFGDAWRAEVIETNPVARVQIPNVREAKKPRVILTDDEFSRFIACADVDLELRMLALLSRVIGGMRAGDLNAWDWSMIDTKDFTDCTVPRSKTGQPQVLAIPEPLAPFLRSWHERAGKPESGPVFPLRQGKRAGEFKGKAGYALRLRKGLIAAGVFRLKPSTEIRKVRTGRGTNTRDVVVTVPAPLDPLYNETPISLSVDFHSFRRAFASALAEAGVNVQHAMHLAAHADPKVHQRYVMQTSAMRTIPAAVVPKLLPEASRIVTARDDSTERTIQTSMISEREKGFEPSTSTLAIHSPAPQSEELRDVAMRARVDEKENAPPRSAVLHGDSSESSRGRCDPYTKRDDSTFDVELELASALAAAARAGAWSVVEQLTRELKARREARERDELVGDVLEASPPPKRLGKGGE